MLSCLLLSTFCAKHTSSVTVPTPFIDDSAHSTILSRYQGKVSPVHIKKDPDPFSLVAASIFHSISTFLPGLGQIPGIRTYLSHYTCDAIFCLCGRLLHADGPRASVANICLYESGTSLQSAIQTELFHDWVWDIGIEDSLHILPWIDDQGHQLRVLIMNLSDDPMLNGLAGSICCGGVRALVHTANTA